VQHSQDVEIAPGLGDFVVHDVKRLRREPRPDSIIRIEREYTVKVGPDTIWGVCAASILPNELETRLEAIFAALDPLRLLDQIGRLQEALWQHAIVRTSPTADQCLESPVRFTATACGLTEHPTPADPPLPPIVHHKRIYQRKQLHVLRWWRTRLDPFADVWTELEQWLEANPTRTAKSIFGELQQRYPEQYPDMQLRTLQRRIAKWRATVVTTFADQWLADEVLADVILPPLLTPHQTKRLTAAAHANWVRLLTRCGKLFREATIRQGVRFSREAIRRQI
jgi:hypothetical protein